MEHGSKKIYGKIVVKKKGGVPMKGRRAGKVRVGEQRNRGDIKLKRSPYPATGKRWERSSRKELELTAYL